MFRPYLISFILPLASVAISSINNPSLSSDCFSKICTPTFNELSVSGIKIPYLANSPTTKNGRYYPIVPMDPKYIAALIVRLENHFRSSVREYSQLNLLAHQQQVIYRVLSKNDDLADSVINYLPSSIRDIAEIHISARKNFLFMKADNSNKNMSRSYLPAWEIVPPEPPSNLLLYYLKAERNTGIDWEILAAINLVETGMGRISGLSTANAKGPMQFLQTTWDEEGIGNDGNVNDPHDSIQAAARYLVRRGGLIDIKKGLWGYNNSNRYGEAVLKYAELMKNDPVVFLSLYNWEIHFDSGGEDIWLPVGYSQNSPIILSTYLKNVPVSSPPDYSESK